MHQAKAVDVHPSFFYTYLKRSFTPNVIEKLNYVSANKLKEAIDRFYRAYDPKTVREHFRTVVMTNPNRYLSITLPMAVELMCKDLKLIEETNHKDINAVLETWILSEPYRVFKGHLPIINTKFALGSIEIMLDLSYRFNKDILPWINMTGYEAIRSAKENQPQQSNMLFLKR
ncbi:hypothetical protein GQ42DRAFT_164500 [Ramicandelaber brevisporus]|nr:hypothetical protein GQ42DRAFT_164500 [Ramicandelaber brevisporus]